jgi:hypothetical protein
MRDLLRVNIEVKGGLFVFAGDDGLSFIKRNGHVFRYHKENVLSQLFFRCHKGKCSPAIVPQWRHRLHKNLLDNAWSRPEKISGHTTFRG